MRASDTRTTNSALYQGSIVHSRRGPLAHSFTRPVVMMYLDLDELDTLRLGPLWSVRRRAPLRFRRSDYLDGGTERLAVVARRVVREALGWEPQGPVRMLTSIRTWGWCFNPLTLYYCFDPAGARVEAVIASVTNTPWGERENYVLDARVGLDTVAPQAKRLHVSPFLSMDLVYSFALSLPAERCSVAITARHGSDVVFRAGMTLRRRRLTARTLAQTMLWRHPFAGQRVSAGIYLEALRLWRKGVRFIPHPPR